MAGLNVRIYFIQSTNVVKPETFYLLNLSYTDTSLHTDSCSIANMYAVADLYRKISNSVGWREIMTAHP